jgi:hypothetical protein
MENANNVIHHLVDGYSWVLPSIDYAPKIIRVGYQLGSKGITYGATYCKIVVATRPATPFNLFEK